MIKSILPIAAVAALSIAPIGALADSEHRSGGAMYVVAENEAHWDGNDYTHSTTDLHIGYGGFERNVGYHVQVGPTFVSRDNENMDVEIALKSGVNVKVSKFVDVYGEVALTTDDELQYSQKIGAKLYF